MSSGTYIGFLGASARCCVCVNERVTRRAFKRAPVWYGRLSNPNHINPHMFQVSHRKQLGDSKNRFSGLLELLKHDVWCFCVLRMAQSHLIQHVSSCSMAPFQILLKKLATDVLFAEAGPNTARVDSGARWQEHKPDCKRTACVFEHRATVHFPRPRDPTPPRQLLRRNAGPDLDLRSSPGSHGSLFPTRMVSCRVGLIVSVLPRKDIFGPPNLPSPASMNLTASEDCLFRESHQGPS